MGLSKRIFHLALLTLVSISTLFASPGLSNLVICLGNDGHFEVEYSVNGKCGTGAEAPLIPSLHGSQGDSHCGTCTDVSFIGQGEGSFRPAQGIDAPQFHSVAGLPVLPSFHLDQAGPGMLPQPPPLESQSLVHLRTIRLLI